MQLSSDNRSRIHARSAAREPAAARGGFSAPASPRLRFLLRLTPAHTNQNILFCLGSLAAANAILDTGKRHKFRCNAASLHFFTLACNSSLPAGASRPPAGVACRVFAAGVPGMLGRPGLVALPPRVGVELDAKSLLSPGCLEGINPITQPRSFWGPGAACSTAAARVPGCRGTRAAGRAAAVRAGSSRCVCVGADNLHSSVAACISSNAAARASRQAPASY